MFYLLTLPYVLSMLTLPLDTAITWCLVILLYVHYHRKASPGITQKIPSIEEIPGKLKILPDIMISGGPHYVLYILSLCFYPMYLQLKVI